MYKELGTYIFDTREGLKKKYGSEYTRDAVAARVDQIVSGFTRRQLELIEVGPSTPPPGRVLRAIAQVLDLPYETLLDKAGYTLSEQDADEAMARKLPLEQYLLYNYHPKNLEAMMLTVRSAIEGYLQIEQGQRVDKFK